MKQLRLFIGLTFTALVMSACHSNEFKLEGAAEGMKDGDTILIFKNAPAELATSSVYGVSVNDETGDIYVMTTDFTNNGQVYHFKSDGSFAGKFAATGINPRKIVFLD